MSGGLRKFCGLFLIVVFSAFAVFAQTTGLPKFKKREFYTSVRTKMIKAGWKPFRSPDAEECLAGDKRCENRPEMESCASTGNAPCIFLWKRKGKTVVIMTVGEEDAVYSGHSFR